MEKSDFRSIAFITSARYIYIELSGWNRAKNLLHVFEKEKNKNNNVITFYKTAKNVHYVEIYVRNTVQ